jgi:hypothetical protein
MKIATLLTLLLLPGIIPGWLTYTDSAHTFTVNYPKEWTIKPVGTAIAFLSPKENAQDPFQENVNIILQDLTAQPMTLDQYTDLSKKQITGAYGASAIVSLKEKSFAGQKTEELIYNMSYQGHALKVKSLWFIKGKTAYLFTYTAEPAQYGKYEETATAVINSFTFLR